MVARIENKNWLEESKIGCKKVVLPLVGYEFRIFSWYKEKRVDKKSKKGWKKSKKGWKKVKRVAKKWNEKKRVGNEKKGLEKSSSHDRLG